MAKWPTGTGRVPYEVAKQKQDIAVAGDAVDFFPCPPPPSSPALPDFFGVSIAWAKHLRCRSVVNSGSDSRPFRLKNGEGVWGVGGMVKKRKDRDK